jgi:anaerobic selenocysteine-containing dehydrogenase
LLCHRQLTAPVLERSPPEVIMDKEVYSLCFMCSVRCPIKVQVQDGQVNWIEGNPKV